MRVRHPGAALLLAAALFAAAATVTSAAPPGASPVSGSSGSANGSCPPPNFANAMKTLILPAYISAPWYIQKQIPLDYQPVDELYCVRAVYEPLDPKNVSAGLIVNNYANKGAVNGRTMGTSKYDSSNVALIALPATFKARGLDGKLLVGPEILLRLLPPGAWRSAFGPYWVVAVGYSQNTTLKYSWAIVSGGAPEIASPVGNGCTSVPYKNGTTPAAAAAAATASAAGGAPLPAGSSWPTGGVAAPGGGPAQWGPAAGGSSGAPGGAPGGGGRPTGSFAAAATFDRGGLWFLSRKPVDPVATAKMEARAKALGLDISQMVAVQQQGCLYLT